MTPYEVLGVDGSAPIEEIETSYRLMLRRFNPKALEQADPATKADAAIRVREIHAAMAQVRKDQRGGGPRIWPFADDGGAAEPEPPSGSGAGGGRLRSTGDGPSADRPTNDAGVRFVDHEWVFDDLLELVPCPYCEEGFLDLESFRGHLQVDHQYSSRDKKRRKARTEPSIVQLLGVTRCVVAGVLTVASIVALLLGATIWIPASGMLIVVLVVMSAALPKANRGTFGSRRVKQHKAIKWF